MVDYQVLFNEMKTLSVLLVEDFEPLRVEMGEVLEHICKTVVIAEEGQKAWFLYMQALQEGNSFDLVISDIQMPNMNGVELSKKIREYNKEQVIIILSAHSDSKYLVDLINIGISKFLAKPINHDDLCDILYEESKKINIYKQENITEVPILNLGEGYTWNVKTMVLLHNNQLVDLTKHELLLLRCFISNKEHICTNKIIIDDFYSKDIDIGEKNIRNLVFKLRKKIPKNSILSMYGLGYKFTLSV